MRCDRMYEMLSPNSSRMPQAKRSIENDVSNLGRQEKKSGKGGLVGQRCKSLFDVKRPLHAEMTEAAKVRASETVFS